VKTPQRFHEISIVRLISAAKPPSAAMRRISKIDFLSTLEINIIINIEKAAVYHKQRLFT